MIKQIGDFDMISDNKSHFGEKLWNILKVSTGLKVKTQLIVNKCNCSDENIKNLEVIKASDITLTCSNEDIWTITSELFRYWEI